MVWLLRLLLGMVRKASLEFMIYERVKLSRASLQHIRDALNYYRQTESVCRERGAEKREAMQTHSRSAMELLGERPIHEALRKGGEMSDRHHVERLEDVPGFQDSRVQSPTVRFNLLKRCVPVQAMAEMLLHVGFTSKANLMPSGVMQVVEERGQV